MEDETIQKNLKGCLCLETLFGLPEELGSPKSERSTYYNRQLYCCNFPVRQGSSTSFQNSETIFIYTWLENERYKKSMNELPSFISFQAR